MVRYAAPPGASAASVAATPGPPAATTRREDALMNETSVSLLERLRLRPEEGDWQRLVELYTPLIRGWLRQHAPGLREADDVVQDVLAVVVRRLKEFEHQRIGSFRRWLRTITVNCLRDHWRAGRRAGPAGSGDSDLLELLGQLEDPRSELSRAWDLEHDRHVTHRLLEMIRDRFEPATWKAFERVALEGAGADQVATELGLSVNAVFIAKSRVLSLLRQVGRGLID